MIVTTDEVAGHRIDAVLGEVKGILVFSTDVGEFFSANWGTLGDGRVEVVDYTRIIFDLRHEVVKRMWADAERRGGNAVVAMRFSTSRVAETLTELCAYGTAVVITPLSATTQPGR